MTPLPRLRKKYRGQRLPRSGLSKCIYTASPPTSPPLTGKEGSEALSADGVSDTASIPPSVLDDILVIFFPPGGQANLAVEQTPNVLNESAALDGVAYHPYDSEFGDIWQ